MYSWFNTICKCSRLFQKYHATYTLNDLFCDGRHRYYMGTIVYRWTISLLHGNHCLQMDDTVITWEPLIDGLMDGALATSAVDCALSPSRVKPKYLVLLRYAVSYHNKTQSMLV
jgi:hypothetical protein